MAVDGPKTPTVVDDAGRGLPEVWRRQVASLAAGPLIGAATGLAFGLTDPAWASWSMFLGALAGAAAAVVASLLGAMANLVFRTARTGVRRAAVVLGTGLGAAGTVAALAQVWHVVPPWSVAFPLAVLVVMSAVMICGPHR
ncbi:hypothetical protein ACFWGN_12950 [Oerskovia sp. NPDC060338]|uniref:hypothetical protein n=1 Tax=Oerskovia sp. NPDC060338 TaxID=3347100 RepID=UPI003664993F